MPFLIIFIDLPGQEAGRARPQKKKTFLVAPPPQVANRHAPYPHTWVARAELPRGQARATRYLALIFLKKIFDFSTPTTPTTHRLLFYSFAVWEVSQTDMQSTLRNSQVVWTATWTWQFFNLLSSGKFPSLGIWRIALFKTTTLI
jgi:hypothetical protein